MTIKNYTCIKPFPHKHQKITVGDEVLLTDVEARPLKHGGFITFDSAAATLIRLLVKGEEELSSEENDASSSVDDNDSDNISETKRLNSNSNAQPAVGYEKGD